MAFSGSGVIASNSSGSCQGLTFRHTAADSKGLPMVIPGDPGPSKDERKDDNVSLASVDNVELKRRVDLVSGISLIVGTMIGSGIFISPKGVAEGSGSVGLSLVSWVICGVVAMLGSLTYCELGTLVMESGGEYAYLKEGLGSIPCFLYAWMSILLLKPASVAIISLTCAEYLMVPLFDDGCGEPPLMETKLVAALAICILAAINIYSVKLATNIQVFFTAAKIIALIIIIIGGIVRMAQGYTQNLASGFDGTESNPGKIAIGLYNGMWAYDGWNNLNCVTEEIINPEKNLPRSILTAIPLVTVLYVLVNISYFTVMSVEQLLASPAVAVTWGEAVIGAAAWIMPISVALSTFGATNGSMFTSGRLTFVAAREGHMLELLSMVHIKKYTPMPSILFTTVLSLIYIIPGDIGSLIDLFSFAVWMVYGATASACIIMRYTTKYKDQDRIYKVPIFIPVLVVILSAFLVIAPIIDDPQMAFLYVAIFILGGLIFYVPFVHYKVFPTFMSHITEFFQLFLECSPAVSEPVG